MHKINNDKQFIFYHQNALEEAEQADKYTCYLSATNTTLKSYAITIATHFRLTGG